MENSTAIVKKCQNNKVGYKNGTRKKTKYTFSGHESFQCKSLWLKKGYDFMLQNKDFNAANAVVDLGVGKNMDSSIRFWLKAFGLRDENGLTPIARYLFDNET